MANIGFFYHRDIYQGVIACMTRRLVVWSFFSFLYSSVQRMECLLQFQWRLIFRERFYWHINNPLPEDYLLPLLSNPQPPPPFIKNVFNQPLGMWFVACTRKLSQLSFKHHLRKEILYQFILKTLSNTWNILLYLYCTVLSNSLLQGTFNTQAIILCDCNWTQPSWQVNAVCKAEWGRFWKTWAHCW